MLSSAHRSLRLLRVPLILGIAALLATFAGVILVAAHKVDTTAEASVASLDAPDFAPTPQRFEVTNVNDSDSGSLRDAIIKANATPGPDTIVFNIPGSGIKVIFILAALPEITDPVVIDATTQPGYAGTPLIELNGAFSQITNGLVIKAGGSTVRGLAIGRFNAAGILLHDCDNNVIQGNHIGVDTTGNVIRNNGRGILFTNSSNNLIGGTTAAARNVISGNTSEGINMGGSSNTIQGNFIGTNAAGTAAVPNGNGIFIGTSPSMPFINNKIGGTSPGAGNLISGNKFSGIFINDRGTVIQGNLIGTNINGSTRIPNATGIEVTTTNTIIGGLTPTARNLISGNDTGITIRGFPPNFRQENFVQGNLIGLNALGTGPLPNTKRGVEISNAAGNTIGGTQAEAANVIAFNGGPGVLVFSGTGNSIRGNAIFSNDGLGIDLASDAVFPIGPDGVTPNDPADSDAGGNRFQNFPVLTSVLSTNNSTTIQGNLNSTPNTIFQIDFYTNAAVDPSGNGEGAQFFNTTSVTTDANGNATINVTFPVNLPAGRAITATATDPDENTSEFSAADSTGLRGSIQFRISSIKVIEDLGTLNLTALRTGGSSGNLTVDYATVDGTAIAGQDYTSTSGTLSFNDGETSKTIQIPILDDQATEPDETFTVVLRNDSNRESIGGSSLLTVTLQDHATIPVVSILGARITEGNPGSATEALFTVSLSAATSRPVTGNFHMVDSFESRTLGTPPGAFGSATCNDPDVDYERTSGTFSFQPGTMTFSIRVKICGDINAERAEGFFVVLTNLSGATSRFGESSTSDLGLILNDDVITLVLEESGPNPDSAAALDAVMGLRDPFRINNLPEWFATGGDRRTRLVLFVRGLRLNPGELPTVVSVRFISAITNERFIFFADDVRPVPNTDLTQVLITLPSSNFPLGTHTVTILSRMLESNNGTIRFGP